MPERLPSIEVRHDEHGGWVWCAGNTYDIHGELSRPLWGHGKSRWRWTARRSARGAIRRHRRHQRLSKLNVREAVRG